MEFPTDIEQILTRIRVIDPKKYASTRNYVDGAVSYLSPYISRGVISTKQVFEHIKSLGLPWHETEKFVQELAWRDYWQQVWIAKEDGIHVDLKNQQSDVVNYEVAEAIIEGKTGIDAVDNSIRELYQTGYMHNHMRMYLASIACNVAKSHWLVPSRWMYANLLDGDLASNQLSWQWVAGAFSNKKYYANQENINEYFRDSQQNTFLDVDYEQFEQLAVPELLEKTIPFELKTNLPKVENLQLDPTKKTLIYNYYNLDPDWYADQDVQRVLLLEPSVFEKYPVADHCIKFMLDLARNIPNVLIFVEHFDVFVKQIDPKLIVFKEHPLNAHYQGQQEDRDWMSSITGYFPSFFGFWKKCKKELIE
ncbi:MAG: FAD-binding domain-containing protein [Crocinitomicaceae bacterium]|nr:FAD-binding domain-containing protein [Crocinitomicaceae bacterium]